VVADGVLHVAAVAVLRHLGPAGQTRHGGALPHRLGGGASGGGRDPQAPQDAVRPRRLAFLPAEVGRQMGSIYSSPWAAPRRGLQVLQLPLEVA